MEQVLAMARLEESTFVSQSLDNHSNLRQKLAEDYNCHDAEGQRSQDWVQQGWRRVHLKVAVEDMMEANGASSSHRDGDRDQALNVIYNHEITP